MLVGSSLTAFIIVVECCRHREIGVAEKFKVASVGHPRSVRCFVVQQQTERLFGVTAIVEPIEGKVGCHIRCVTATLHLFAIANECRIVIIALSNENIPMVEACRFRGQMPFSYYGSLVALRLQQFGECLLSAVKRRAVVGESIGKAMLSGEHTGATGTTY